LKIIIGILLKMDIIINITDDLIDNTKHNINREMLTHSLTYNILLSHLIYKLIFDTFSGNGVINAIKNYNILNKIKNHIYRHILALPIIPLEEKRVYDYIMSFNEFNDNLIKETLINLYLLRGEDIKLFVALPLLVSNYPHVPDILEAAVSFRALQLLYKDRKDLEWDKYHGTPSPFVLLFLLNINENMRQKLISDIESSLRNNLDSSLEKLSKMPKIGKERAELLKEYFYKRISET